MKKKLDFILPYIFLLFPFIDFLTGILSWENMNYSFGIWIKGLFLIIVILYLVKYYPNKKIFLFLGFYFIIYFLYLILYPHNIIVELTNMVKIFYLPLLILFFSIYENSKITKKTIMYIFLFYLLLYLVPFCFGLGHNMNEIYANKSMYFSYFYIGNELINIFITLLPVVILYLLESNSYLLQIIFISLLVMATYLLGTKTYYASVGIIIFYFIVCRKDHIKKYVSQNQLKVLLFIGAILVAGIVYIPKMDLYHNVETSLNYYQIDHINELFTLENIDHIVYSNRLTFLENINQDYVKSTPLEKMLGLGQEKILAKKNIEIDIFDIFYSIGIIGFAFYLFFFVYSLKQTKLKPVYKLSFILLVVVSCFSGHVLLSPMVTTYLALLFLISKNDHGKEKKNILFVSNMYPSSKNPSYGSFVLNTYQLLKEAEYSIDLVVMTKTTNKIKKLIAYVKLCVVSFIKATFENYDYIYVHFISHSAVGVYLPYILSRNTQLVLNGHGNDLVGDTKVDERYLKLSNIFIKRADSIIVPSTYFKNIVIKNFKIAKNKVVVYPSGGINVQTFKKENMKIAKQKMGLKEDIKYFGFIARIEKDKGYDTLILAINELKKAEKLKKIKFLIVGSGSEEDRLDEMIKKYKVSSYVERRPLVSQSELVDVYNSLEAYIYPTRRKSESLGLTGLEAMACETLIIGSNKYGPSDYLIDQVNSITFDPTDYKQLAEKIISELNMKKKEKNKLIAAAKEKSNEYNYENTKSVLLKVFKK